MSSHFPWQTGLWARLQAMRQRMPHALLLHGAQGIGKLQFAHALARGLLCETPGQDGHACGVCSSCNWLAQGNHPDFRLIEPEDQADEPGEAGDGAEEGKGKRKSRLILIQQVRAIADLVGLTTHRHGLRVVLLHPAEAMNPASANALLKMLEEPPPSTVFLLVTHQLARVLPTIRSRCHKLAMPMPDRTEAESWLTAQGIEDPGFCLAQSGGAPLAAMDIDSEEVRTELLSFAGQLGRVDRLDAMATAAHWGRAGYGLALSALQKWCHDLALVRFAGTIRYFPAQSDALHALTRNMDLGALLEFQRVLGLARAQVQHPLNSELQLEALLVRYTQMFSMPARP